MSTSMPMQDGPRANPGGGFFGGVADAARYWEPLRVVYNFLLLATTGLWVAFSWPHFREALTVQSLGIMLVLALIANLCYCAAYAAEVPLQLSLSGISRLRWRSAVWVMGTLFAILLANYWIADEIYPFVR